MTADLCHSLRLSQLGSLEGSNAQAQCRACCLRLAQHCYRPDASALMTPDFSL